MRKARLTDKSVPILSEMMRLSAGSQPEHFSLLRLMLMGKQRLDTRVLTQKPHY